MDHRHRVLLLYIWLFLMGVGFVAFGGGTARWFNFGPSPDLKLVDHIPIDTWSKWLMFNVISSIEVILFTNANETIRPWIITKVLTNDRTIRLDYSRGQTVATTVGYSFAEDITMRILWVIYAIMQIDILIIRIIVENLVTAYVTWNFVKRRVMRPARSDVELAPQAESPLERGGLFASDDLENGTGAGAADSLSVANTDSPASRSNGCFHFGSRDEDEEDDDDNASGDDGERDSVDEKR